MSWTWVIAIALFVAGCGLQPVEPANPCGPGRTPHMMAMGEGVGYAIVCQ
jgi:hypothetical protein